MITVHTPVAPHQLRAQINTSRKTDETESERQAECMKMKLSLEQLPARKKHFEQEEASVKVPTSPASSPSEPCFSQSEIL